MSEQLERFFAPHRRDFATALKEIRAGRKRTHWMWYIFPQLRGLGHSPTAQYYGIQDLHEADAFLHDPYLGGSLTTISEALLALETCRAGDVFDPPDDMKLRSCMTLFALAAGRDSVFHRVLDKYFGGRMDDVTLRLLGR